jgi:tetratricopeptide (TPR) repeat protein
MLEGLQIGLETGDLNFAAMSIFGYIFHSYWIGKELAGLEQELREYNETVEKLKKEFILDLNSLYRQIVLNLLGRSKDPCCLVGESYDEGQMLPIWLEMNNRNVICEIYLNKLILCYLFQSYYQAFNCAVRAEEYLDGLAGTVAIPPFHLYDSLTRLALIQDTQKSERESHFKKVAANQEKMKLWAQHAPMNFLHKFYLVEAERARVLENHRDAREYYDQSIDLAREHGYVNEEALANELAAEFYLEKGQVRLGQHYLRDAHYAYVRWLDLTSVLHASQAISSEIFLDKLLTTLMRLAIENAGAQRGLLILEKDGKLFIEAEGVLDQDKIAVLQSVPAESSRRTPCA